MKVVLWCKFGIQLYIFIPVDLFPLPARHFWLWICETHLWPLELLSLCECHLGMYWLRLHTPPPNGKSSGFFSLVLNLCWSLISICFAGYGGLSLSIEGPSKADIECKDNDDGTCGVTYKPTEPGTYIINIKFADVHVPGK